MSRIACLGNSAVLRITLLRAVGDLLPMLFSCALLMAFELVHNQHREHRLVSERLENAFVSFYVSLPAGRSSAAISLCSSLSSISSFLVYRQARIMTEHGVQKRRATPLPVWQIATVLLIHV